MSRSQVINTGLLLAFSVVAFTLGAIFFGSGMDVLHEKPSPAKDSPGEYFATSISLLGSGAVLLAGALIVSRPKQ